MDYQAGAREDIFFIIYKSEGVTLLEQKWRHPRAYGRSSQNGKSERPFFPERAYTSDTSREELRQRKWGSDSSRCLHNSHYAK